MPLKSIFERRGILVIWCSRETLGNNLAASHGSPAETFVYVQPKTLAPPTFEVFKVISSIFEVVANTRCLWHWPSSPGSKTPMTQPSILAFRGAIYKMTKLGFYGFQSQVFELRFLRPQQRQWVFTHQTTPNQTLYHFGKFNLSKYGQLKKASYPKQVFNGFQISTPKLER